MRRLGSSLDETVTRSDVVALGQVFGVQVDVEALDAITADALPAGLLRSSAFLTHPVFNTHHSEHELLRYLRMLADKDLAMDRTMIPLGSCTMKLNATAEMISSDVAGICLHSSIGSGGCNGAAIAS